MFNMLLAAMLFLPVLIFLAMNRILGKQLLKEGKKEKIIIFAVLCFSIYVLLLVLIAKYEAS